MAPPRAPQDHQPAKKTASKRPASSLSQREKMATASRAASRRTRSAAENTLTSEQLADEVELERPEGLPDVRPLIALRRRQRAQRLAALGAMRSKLTATRARKLEAAAEQAADAETDAQATAAFGGERNAIARMADLTALIADVEDFLRAVAVDAAEMDEWVEDATDEQLMAAFGWYQQEYPEGEADASPS